MNLLNLMNIQIYASNILKYIIYIYKFNLINFNKLSKCTKYINILFYMNKKWDFYLKLPYIILITYSKKIK